MNKITSNIHESFNAKNLTIKKLCESFIINEHFHKLAGSDHSIMIGPRGSGKTTLMKMLQIEALSQWEAIEASNYRSKIAYSGVFIPTDRLWKKQYENLTDKYHDNVKKLRALDSIFVFHVLERLSYVVEVRSNRLNPSLFRGVLLSKNDEVSMVNELSAIWHVNPKINTLKSLNIEMASSKYRLSNYIIDDQEDKDYYNDLAFFDIENMVGLLELSVKIINAYFQEGDAKWCFLFDELELAPESIVQPLIDRLRGGPENIIFKLSLSPYHSDIKITENSNSPMDKQDYTFINLSNVKDDVGQRFSKQLCQKIFDRYDFLGDIESFFSEPKKKNNKIVFEELVEKDPTFSEYLIQNKIDLSKFEEYKESNKLTLIRKIQFVAHLRNEFIGKSFRLKGRRRAVDYYSGFKKICKALEYNPRMLISITNLIAESFVADKKKPKISVNEQISALEEVYNSYVALLNTIPIDVDGYDTLYSLVDGLAKEISFYIKGDRFYPEPYGYFSFSEEPGDDLRKAVGYALNAGAFVIDDSDRGANANIGSLHGINFRLSYIFSHKYGLLMNKPRKIEFMKVLRGSKVSDNLSIMQMNLI